jgi:hypothetical protein
MSPEAFVELLAHELRVAGVVVGSNYRFGYRAAGTASLLTELGVAHGIEVEPGFVWGGRGGAWLCVCVCVSVCIGRLVHVHGIAEPGGDGSQIERGVSGQGLGG